MSNDEAARNSATQTAWGCVAVLIVIVVVVALGWIGCGKACGGLNSPEAESETHLSPAANAYLDKTMPKLAAITEAYQAGDIETAVRMWKSIGSMPQKTTMDYVVGKDFLEYANNVRYYMLDDGSCTLKQLEDSRADAESTIAAEQ